MTRLHEHPRFRIGLAAAVAVAAGLFFASRMGWIRIAGHGIELGSPRRADVVRDGLRAYAVTRVRAWPEWSSEADIAGALRLAASGDVRRYASGDCADADSLIRAAAGFIWHRFARFDAGAYFDWRVADGYTPASPEELAEGRGLGGVWASGFDEPFPSSPARVREAFVRTTARWAELFPAGARETGLASDAKGLFVRIGQVRADAWTWGLEPPEGGEISADLWLGQSARTDRSWWTAVDIADRIAAKHGSVCVGEVGAIFAYGDGTRGPKIIRFMYDPDQSRWIHFSLSDQNMTDVRSAAAVEF